MTGPIPTSAGDALLEQTQRIRQQLINTATDDGKFIPTCLKERKALRETLNDMDKQVINVKRIAVDQVNGDAMTLARAIAAEIIGRYGNQDPNRVPEGRTAPVELGEVLDLPPTLVPGVMDIGLATDDHDTFMAKWDGEQTDS